MLNPLTYLIKNILNICSKCKTMYFYTNMNNYNLSTKNKIYRYYMIHLTYRLCFKENYLVLHLMTNAL